MAGEESTGRVGATLLPNNYGVSQCQHRIDVFAWSNPIPYALLLIPHRPAYTKLWVRGELFAISARLSYTIVESVLAFLRMNLCGDLPCVQPRMQQGRTCCILDTASDQTGRLKSSSLRNHRSCSQITLTIPANLQNPVSIRRCLQLLG
jgi:hypothetical protein